LATDARISSRLRARFQGIDEGLRIRDSNSAGFVKIAGSTVPARRLEVDADQILERLKEIPDRTGRDEVIRRLGLPFRSPMQRRPSR
jgi:hypothetical protein